MKRILITPTVAVLLGSCIGSNELRGMQDKTDDTTKTTKKKAKKAKKPKTTDEGGPVKKS